jgi:hypothetical protein
VKRKTTMTPEPEHKLDAGAAMAAAVSGPEDVSDWHAVDWRACENNVRRLRQRIFTASKAGDLARVRRLQRLMLGSRSNALVSVRRVTERNAGRLTAGVDGEIVLTAEAKLALASRIQPPRRYYGPSSRPRALLTDSRAPRRTATRSRECGRQPPARTQSKAQAGRSSTR